MSDDQQLSNNEIENDSKRKERERKEQRAIDMSNECRQRLIESMKKINSKIMTSRSTGNNSGSTDNSGNSGNNNNNSSSGIALLFSGGIDSCAILEVASIIGMELDLLITVVIGECEEEVGDEEGNDENENDDKEKKQSYSNYGPDLEYSIHAAATAASSQSSQSKPTKHKQPKHIIIKLTRNALISHYVESTIQTLACWGRMDIRNSLVISAAMNYAAIHNITDVVVGDGCDELFGGYEFMFGIPGENIKWKEKRNAMINQWTFVTTKLGNSYGLNVHEPYMDQALFIDWTLQEVERSDCISDATVSAEESNDAEDSNGDSNNNDSTTRRRRGIQSIYNGPYTRNETYGKVLLREAFPNLIAAYRRMDFIDRGSGAISINEDSYWTTQHNITDQEFQMEKKKLQVENGIVITCKEHLYNIRFYQTIFGHSLTKHPTKNHYPKIKNGDDLQHDRRGCMGCCFEIQDAMFCHVCDLYPAQLQLLHNTTTAPTAPTDTATDTATADTTATATTADTAAATTATTATTTVADTAADTATTDTATDTATAANTAADTAADTASDTATNANTTTTATDTATATGTTPKMKIIRITILYSPPPDVGPGDGDDASQSYALRASEFFLNKSSTTSTTQIRIGYVGPLAVNDNSDVNGLPWCINNDDNNNASSAETATTTPATTIDITLFLISCTADGSVNRSVRKITRKLKSNNNATTTTTAGSSSTTASVVVVGLLGHARCDNSSKQMADTIFGTNGRKFDKALQQQQQHQQSSSNNVVSPVSLSLSTTRLETQVELYGPEQDFDPWLEGLLQQFNLVSIDSKIIL